MSNFQDCVEQIYRCFFYLGFFHEYSQFTRQQGKWEAISLTPLYHFNPTIYRKHLFKLMPKPISKFLEKNCPEVMLFCFFSLWLLTISKAVDGKITRSWWQLERLRAKPLPVSEPRISQGHVIKGSCDVGAHQRKSSFYQIRFPQALL